MKKASCATTRRAMIAGMTATAGSGLVPGSLDAAMASMSKRIETDSVVGWYDDAFQAVADVFVERIASGKELGASFCLYHRGKAVVDLWGGIADPESGKHWQRGTASVLMSATKALAYACIYKLAEREKIDLDAPVSSYWPAFAAAGKSRITVREVMAHRAGIPALDRDLGYQDLHDHQPLLDAIAAQPPLWEPGTRHGYHPLTTGWILSELLRRIDGRSARTFFDDEFARPLGLNLTIGNLDPKRDFAPLLRPPPGAAPGMEQFYAAMADPASIPARSFAGPQLTPYDFNAPEAQALEIPSGNGIGDGRSLARFYASLIGPVDGRRVLSAESIADAVRTVSSGHDAVVLLRTDFGTGFFLPGGPMFAESRPGSFGHGGSGGALGLADPAHEMALGFVMNQMAPGLGATEKTDMLLSRTYECIDRLSKG